MKIINLKAENVKRIKAIEITPKGAVVEIAGKNGQGKTSALDCITMALLGKRAFPDNPLRNGAGKGGIDVDLGEFRIHVTLTETGQSLAITTKDGAKMSSPQAFLDTIVGKISFDPLEFSRLPDAQQVRMLVEMIGIDPWQFDAAIKVEYDERTVIGRDVKRLKGAVDSMIVTPGFPEEEIKTADLFRALEEINRTISDRALLGKRLESHTTMIKQQKNRISDLKSEIASLEKATAEMESEREEGVKKYGAMEEQDPAPIRAQISSADETNAKIRANREHAKTARALAERESAYQAKSDAIAALEVQKRELLANAKFPVKGLSFGDGGLLYKGQTLRDTCDSDKIKIGLALGMALNPDLKVLRVKEGSLLDDDSKALIHKMVSGRGYQLWIETVGEGGASAIVIEDGTIGASREKQT